MPSQPEMNWASSIPWIVAAVGWAFTHLLSEARERRKEVRAQIDKLYEQLYKIEQDARDFHCSDSFDSTKAGDVSSKIQILERSMTRIPIFVMDRFTSHIIHLRRAVTMKNFDRSDFVQQIQESDILQAIFSASQDIEEEMERQYRDNYKATFPYFKFSRKTTYRTFS